MSATDAKNQFGLLLEEVLAGGRVEITKHGRVVAVLQSARTAVTQDWQPEEARARESHFIPPRLARAAKIVKKRGR